MKQKIVNCYLFIVLVTFDQITKLIFSSRDFFVGPIHFHEMNNYGLSFSLNFGPVINLMLIAVGLIAFAVYYWKRRNICSNLEHLAFVFIFAGAIGNIIDRVWFNYVRDFVDLGLGFTFNFADVFVVIGIIILLTQPKTK